MKKSQYFRHSRFPADAIIQSKLILEELQRGSEAPFKITKLEVEHDDSIWTYENFDEFISDYRKFSDGASFWARNGSTHLSISQYNHSDADRYAMIGVEAEDRETIYRLFEVFERHKQSAFIEPSDDQIGPQDNKIFIGHGRTDAWRNLRDHLVDKHGFKVVSYESGSRSGHVIRDILEDMAASSSFALIVMTGEDEQVDGALRARQNVVHEAGLFQGRLGFSRAVVLLEEGVERFSNLDGIQYISFQRGNIREAFGDVLAVIRREFGS
jgi:predicted nucleotide-binding protein